MPEIVLILIVVAILFYVMATVTKKASFDINEDGIYFHAQKVLIPYSSVISIERDCTLSAESGTTMYIAYVITYYTGEGKKDSFRFYRSFRSLADGRKWKSIKAQIINRNPNAFINESIL